MARLTDDMKRVITEQRLGFVATVNADGTPNLSPKGTMVVLGDEQIAFGEIRSPNTIRNLADRPAVEINFVDPTARKGYRFSGQAEVIPGGRPPFDELFPEFARWGGLADSIRAIVRVRIDKAAPLTSPAYDHGATEAELRASWLAHLQDIQPQRD